MKREPKSPGRPPRPHLVEPRELPRRRLGTAEGRATLLHALAHIEFNAINIALDAVYRFRDVPVDFVGDWLLVGLDSCLAGQAGGAVSEEELERLAEIVGASAARHVLVFLHHPPVPMGSKWLDSVGMANGEQVLERLRTLGRVRALVFGHVHQEYDDMYEGIRIMATPSTCRQFMPASDEFAVDDRPPAYRRIELRSDGDLDTQLIWVDQ